MEFKKIISLSAACMLICSNVYANGVDIEKTNNKVTVKAVIQSGEEALLRVVADGHGANEYGFVYAFDEAVADSDGNVVFEFNMQDSKNGVSSNGKYNVYIKSGSGEEREGYFWYATEESRMALAELLKGADGNSLYEIAEDENNKVALNAAGFAMDFYEEVSDKKDICRKAAGSGDVAKTFTELAVLSYINESGKADEVKEALLLTGFEFDGKEFGDLEDEALADWITECIAENGSYSDYEELSDEYVKANVLYTLQSTRFNKIKQILKQYEDELGIEGEDAYEEYLDASDSVSKKLEEKLEDRKPSTTAQLLDIIEDCLSKKKESSSGGSSGGGGGGYNTKVTNNLPALVVEQDKKEEEQPKQRFNDMKDAAWAETAVNIMAEKGIVSGDGYGAFRPNDSVTREEFVKMIITASGKYDENAVCDFADVDESAWYATYVASGINSGIIKGVSETEFGIGKTLTRQDMAVMCARALSEINAVREDVEFADESEISDYAKESIHKLYTAGLIDGMGGNTFSPKTSATRAQAAQIIYNLFVK